MAEGTENHDRTEEPTQRRLDDAHERGDVVKSQEVNTWFILASGALVVMIFSVPVASDLRASLRGLVANAHVVATDGPGIIRLVERLGFDLMALLALPFLLLAVGAAAGNVIQHRPVWSLDPLIPRLSKVSPAAGLKRLMSKQAVMNLVRGVFKLAIVAGLIAYLMWPERRGLDRLVTIDVAAILPITHGLALRVLGGAVAVLALVAAADFLYQHATWRERHKMSLREIKDEFKQTEGDPAVKSKIKQLRQTRAKKRMIAAVPKAAVVIANPTHYAVALQYERGMNAPLCVAKGVEAIAQRIKEVAAAHRIPVVENVPLARALYAAVEVDREIPADHYKAVAEVIGYVMRLRAKTR